jgi:hypothetical protein
MLEKSSTGLANSSIAIADKVAVKSTGFSFSYTAFLSTYCRNMAGYI